MSDVNPVCKAVVRFYKRRENGEWECTPRAHWFRCHDEATYWLNNVSGLFGSLGGRWFVHSQDLRQPRVLKDIPLYDDGNPASS